MLRKLMVLTLVMFIAIRGAAGQSCSADIVFVVDESSSISSSWFDVAKQFMSDFLDCFVNIHDIWVGVIPYHCVPRTYFSLSQPSDPSIFDGLLKAGGLSRIGLAIRYTQATSHFRDGVPRAAIILTDGQSEGPTKFREPPD
ncbi:collagen alpha-3(VI) chain-like [Branchiostoma floridae]|uniref:Collagen alpha-3(VI) chain-like n=1 Tax=Branchiostoma floridae TaxID=7739 RepID=A0A9J7N286_BRAFL|nr:collagen alpha-3(VI) chain-like [Branchiostoma floridae]